MKGEIRLIPYEVKANVMEAKETPESIQEIKAPELWSSGFKGKGITIAVLDTGCDTEHPDLKDQIIGGKNFTDDDDGDAENVKDYNGHGTHVAGTIAATDQNGGILGVAPEAKLLIVKVLGGENGSGKYEWIIDGINYAAEQKVDIISMSLGGPSNEPALQEAIQNAVKVVCLLCAQQEMKGTGTSVRKSSPTQQHTMKSLPSVLFPLLENPLNFLTPIKKSTSSLQEKTFYPLFLTINMAGSQGLQWLPLT